ncbi:MAG: hypothetical protein LBD75_05080 [Candidatus Peribacteria bacterium]|nr:hypothetical protein [Candidatus Peribacteria bacterium]
MDDLTPDNALSTFSAYKNITKYTAEQSIIKVVSSAFEKNYSNAEIASIMKQL